MDSASISALSVLGGSLVGALTSLASTWLTQQHLDRRETLGREIAARETLYGNFISEASRAIVDAFGNSLERIEGLIPLYALLGRIRLVSSEAVLTAAEQVSREIVTSYARPNGTTEEFRALILGSAPERPVDLMAEFSRVCREELRVHAIGGSLRHRGKRRSP